MAAAFCKVLRKWVAPGYYNGEGSYAGLAESLQIGIATVKRWMWRRRRTGDVGTLFANDEPECVFTTPENLELPRQVLEHEPHARHRGRPGHA